MTTAEMSEAIIRKIVEECNEGHSLGFESDCGDNSLTILHDESHTHVGTPDGSFKHLVKDLYNTLHGGPGLSWA